MKTNVKSLLAVMNCKDGMAELATFLQAETIAAEDEVYITLIHPENKCIYISDITKVGIKDLMAIDKAVKAVLEFRLKEQEENEMPKKMKKDKKDKKGKKAKKDKVKEPKAEEVKIKTKKAIEEPKEEVKSVKAEVKDEAVKAKTPKELKAERDNAADKAGK